jgi:hypothetical protein
MLQAPETLPEGGPGDLTRAGIRRKHLSAHPIAEKMSRNFPFPEAPKNGMFGRGKRGPRHMCEAPTKAEWTMGKRDELIAKYADDLKTKCKVTPDMALLTKVTIGCGPAIYDNDAQTVAASQATEMDRIKKNFLVRKLGLKDDAKLDEGIAAAVETYGKSERNKYRAVFYYLLVKHFGKEKVYA